jgi:hypothetical protein
VGRQFEKMATEIVEALERSSILLQGAGGPESATRSAKDILPNDAQDQTVGKIALPMPPTVIVDAMH